MAASLLLRRGRAGALQAILLEARVFRGLASTVPLSAELGKNEKGLPSNPKKQSPSKNVVQPKERGKLLPTHTAAALAKHFPPPGSRPSVGDKGGAVASPHPGGSKQLTDEGVPKSLSRKTLVEFPQKIPPPFPEQASDSDSSSSSSTSSSSDSESDEEGSVTQVGPRMTSRGKGETAHPSKKRHPQSAISAKEKNRAQKPDTNVTYPEKPHQPKKKGTLTKPLEDSTEAKPKHLTPRSQADEEVLKQNLKEEQLQKILRLSEIEKESQQLFEVKEISPEHTKTGLSAGFSGGQVSIPWTEPARARGQLPAADPGDPKVPEPGWEAASPLIRVENVGKQVTEGHSKAKEEILGDPVPVRNLKMVPVEKKGVFDETTAGLTLKGGLEETVSTALHMEDSAALHVEDSAALHVEDVAQHAEAQGNTQEPTQVEPDQALAPTDSATYKNLQHHDYNTYTFLDLNLNLSKFRLPQPSSGRESPRH